MQHARHLSADTTAAVARLLLASLLHCKASVQREAAAAAARCMKVAPKLHGEFIGALLALLQNVHAVAVSCVVTRKAYLFEESKQFLGLVHEQR